MTLTERETRLMGNSVFHLSFHGNLPGNCLRPTQISVEELHQPPKQSLYEVWWQGIEWPKDFCEKTKLQKD